MHRSTWVALGDEPDVRVALVSSKTGKTLTRLTLGYATKAEAQAEADRRNAKAAR